MGKDGPKIEFNGESHTIEEWAQIVLKPVKAIRMRLARGWTVEEALTLPLGTTRKKFARPCNKCKYGKWFIFGGYFCDYLHMTGHARTVENGIKVDKCPYIRNNQLSATAEQKKGKDIYDREQEHC